jgi:hypothetical protein
MPMPGKVSIYPLSGVPNRSKALNLAHSPPFLAAAYSPALEYMIRWDPHRLTGLDLLSTTLWHLRREVGWLSCSGVCAGCPLLTHTLCPLSDQVDLCYLAQRATDFDRLHPHTWCVVGNCFSLQKDPKTALRFFERAIQVGYFRPHFMDFTAFMSLLVPFSVGSYFALSSHSKRA